MGWLFVGGWRGECGFVFVKERIRVGRFLDRVFVGVRVGVGVFGVGGGVRFVVFYFSFFC